MATSAGKNARVLGHDVVVVDDAAAVRGLIGLTGQFASIDDDLSGRENLVLQGRLLGLDRSGASARAGELLEQFELADAARRPVKTCSGGMQRRLDIATTLVVPPRLLFLDEPTTGLDPVAEARSGTWSGLSLPTSACSGTASSTGLVYSIDGLTRRLSRPPRANRAR